MKRKFFFVLLFFSALSAFSAVINPNIAHADGLVVVNCPPIALPLGTPVPQPGTDFITPFPPRTIPPPLPPIRRDCPNYLSVKNHNVTVTIENQIARTHVDETFINDSTFQLEGTYIFPLPDDAAIGDFAMWVDGKKLEGRVLDKNEARQIYEDIVRRQRDPALLEYVGRNAFQARIFPIAPNTQKRVEIDYSQILKADQGLVRYIYPLNTEKFSPKPLGNVSINVSVRSNSALKAIYSPSHTISVVRDGDTRVRVGYEDSNVKPDRDFVLYYSVTQDTIGLNVLSFKEGKDDGYFVMLVAPPSLESATGGAKGGTTVIAKDVILILDVSGSMQGPKITQARRALNYVLDQLNGDDRFNVISFSTGTSAFASALQPVSRRADAKDFVARLRADGSTDINRALLEAASLADRERPTIVIFLTDGLPTTGETNPQRIIANVTKAARSNMRLFTFGVGDDVNTILLDSLAEKLRGASGYVRPNESIEEIVSAFYAKVSLPILSDVTIDWGNVTVGDVYPSPMPDLFAGSQIVVAGRYRPLKGIFDKGGSTTITLKGNVNGVPQSFKYDSVTFLDSSGDVFVPRLWATRKIGYLLNQIRLQGESKEIVNEIVAIAVRFGIVTPYTSFLIDERQDVLTQQGRSGAAQDMSKSFAPAAAPTSGASAVQQSQQQNQLRRAETAQTTLSDQIRIVGDKTLILRNGTWIDTQFDPSKMVTTKIKFGSEQFFVLANNSSWGKYFALGSHVIVVLDETAYEIIDNGEEISQPIRSSPVASTPTVESKALPVSTPMGIATPRLINEFTPEPNSGQRNLVFGIGLLVIGLIGIASLVSVILLRRK